METPAYNNAAGLTKEKQPELISSLERFKNQNDRSYETALSIKDRLNRISRTEYKSDPIPTNPIPEKEVQSGMDEFNAQLNKQYEINLMLSDILLHLKEIV